MNAEPAVSESVMLETFAKRIMMTVGALALYLLSYFANDLINANRSCTCCVFNLSPKAGMMRDLPLALPPLVIIATMNLSVSP
jgi:hypothetical protein